MGAKKLFKKIGRGIQTGIGQGYNEFSKGVGKVLGPAAAAAMISAAPYVMAAAPVVALKVGGRIPGNRNKPVHFIGHGSEYILPANASPTKKQKAIVASNKKKQKMVKFV